MTWKNALLLAVVWSVSGFLHAAINLPLYSDEKVTLTFRSDADALTYDHPLVGTLEAVSKNTEEVSVPNLQGRFRGFMLVEDFSAGKTVANGKTLAQWRFRLTPEAIAPWQIKPFVFTVKNLHTGATQTYLTQQVTFPEPTVLPVATGAIEYDPIPEWVAPGWKTYRVWLLAVVCLLALTVACLPLFKRLKRVLHERTLSPEERASLELERLLAEGLVAQGQFKRFYYGLTGVVRRYFERGYALRATRQTSQEFLTALAKDSRVSVEERDALAQFLTLADKIKFAGILASAPEAEVAVNTVRTLLAKAATHRQETENSSI